jgi:hypothetical protein
MVTVALSVKLDTGFQASTITNHEHDGERRDDA